MKRHRDDARKTLLAPLRQREDLAQLAVAELRGRAEEILARIEQLKGQLAGQNRRARQTLIQDGAGAAMGSYRKCAAQLGEALDAEKDRLAGLHEQLHHGCNDLVEARKQRRALETVVDRAGGRREAAARAAGGGGVPGGGAVSRVVPGGGGRRGGPPRAAGAREIDDTYQAHNAWRADQTDGGAPAGAEAPAESEVRG